MAKYMVSLLEDFEDALRDSLGRFPVLLACAITWACALSFALHHGASKDTVHLAERIAMAAVAGIPLAFGLQIFAETSQPRLLRWGQWVTLPLLALYFVTLPSKGFDGPSAEIIRWGLILGALHLAAAVSGHTRKSEDGFWQFNRRLFQGFCVACLYTGVLVAGLELALLSADKLFDLKLDKAYADLFLFISGGIHPIFFLRAVPSDFGALRSDTEHPRALKSFTQFALAPLVAVFTLILYVYAAKISLTGTWPHGWVALPVLLLAGFGILSFLLLHPLRENEDERWARWYCLWFPRALAPLSILLLLALRERIEAYGFTEERYLGLCAGGCILLWALVTSLNRRAGIRWLPIVLGAVALLSALGPWGAVAVSLQSQLRRLENTMTQHGLLVGGKVLIPEQSLKLPQKEFDDFRNTLNHIGGRNGEAPLRTLLQTPLETAVQEKEQTRWNFTQSIIKQLRISGASHNGHPLESITLDKKLSIPLEGFSHVSPVVDLREAFERNPAHPALPVLSKKLWLKIEQSTLKAAGNENGPFEPLPLESFYSALTASPAPLSQMSFDWEHQGQSYRLIFTSVALIRSDDAPSKLSSCSLFILEK